MALYHSGLEVIWDLLLKADPGRDRAEACAPCPNDKIAFPRAPLQSRKVGLPDSGFDLGLSSGDLSETGEAQALARIRPTNSGLPLDSSLNHGSSDLRR